ncbi:MAG: hypothetical protein R3Y10_08980 [Ferrimonas sp.]
MRRGVLGCVLSCVLLQCGCRHLSPPQTTLVPPVVDAEVNHFIEIVSQLRQLQIGVNAPELAWMAPEWHQQARTHLQDAKRYFAHYQFAPNKRVEPIGVFSQRSYYQATLDALTDSRDALEQALVTQQLAQTIFADALANQQQLNQLAYATLLQPQAWQLEQRLRGLVRLAAEPVPLQVQQQQDQLLAEQQQLTQQLIQYWHAQS